MKQIKIAIVEDDVTFRNSLEIFFDDYQEYETIVFKNAKDALLELDKNSDFDLVITDIDMPKMSGLEMIKILNTRYQYIVITGKASLQYAIEAIRLGVNDFIIKGTKFEDIITSIKNVVKQKEKQLKSANTKRAKKSTKELVIFSQKSAAYMSMAKKVADSDVSVMLLGENGVGKEEVAKFIHQSSSRAKGPFLAINMTTFSSTLESQLFGHVKGAFTDATEDKKGLFEMANGGTLLLDEIGDMPPHLQAKLLRVLQEKEVLKMGDTKTTPIDVRFISATNSNMGIKLKNGDFRTDLFFRLNEFDIEIPPLRERIDEIIPLAEQFLRDMNSQKKLSEEAKKILMNYKWPGNIRELKASIKRSVIMSDGDIIEAKDFCLDTKTKLFEFLK